MPCCIVESLVGDEEDVFEGGVASKIEEVHLGVIQVSSDVFFDPTRDEEAQGYAPVLMEEPEKVINHRCDLLAVITFIKAVEDNDERPFEYGLCQTFQATVRIHKWLKEKELQLQGKWAQCQQAGMCLDGCVDERYCRRDKACHKSGLPAGT